MRCFSSSCCAATSSSVSFCRSCQTHSCGLCMEAVGHGICVPTACSAASLTTTRLSIVCKTPNYPVQQCCSAVHYDGSKVSPTIFWLNAWFAMPMHEHPTGAKPKHGDIIHASDIAAFAVAIFNTIFKRRECSPGYHMTGSLRALQLLLHRARVGHALCAWPCQCK